MARALLSKVHPWRSVGVVNYTTPSTPSTPSTRTLTYFLLSNYSKLQSNQLVPRHSSSNSDQIQFVHRTYCTGPNDSPLMQSMENKIKEQLNAESVTVKDAYGDGRHVSISVISTAFEGQNIVTRQRTVYKAIWEELQDPVHAVHQMITLTPTEAKTKSQ